ncbi:MAG: alpha/beta fold hydrolase [Zoogloeaceae bacterium]|jgi:predicted esterase YcpF (UPF0227 family)|nr:alpha/beta fold hydrolase [Zoogloeaceae bacterium]
MDGTLKRILYLHGFASSPRSWKAVALREAMAARGLADRLDTPAIPWPPDAAVAALETCVAARLEAGATLTLAGSSLGGYYASWLAERHDLRAALINPAVAAHLTPERHLGVWQNQYTDEALRVKAAHIDFLRGIAVETPTPERYLLLLETGDEVLDCRLAQAHYAGACQQVCAGGNHSFTRFAEFIPQILEFAGL